MYTLDCTLSDGARKSLILTSGEFLTHKIKAKGVKITNNLSFEYLLLIVFATLNDNDYAIKRSFTEYALNQEYASLNFGDASTYPDCDNIVSGSEYVICFNNVTDQYTGEFMLYAQKINDDWEPQTLTDEDVEYIKNNIIVEPTDVFDYKGFYVPPGANYVASDWSNVEGMALLPPTNDPDSSMSFIYRVPSSYMLRVSPDEEEYGTPVKYNVYEGDELIGFNGMFEDIEHFRYCLPTWSPILLRFDSDYNRDSASRQIAPNDPITYGVVELKPYQKIYHNDTNTTKAVIVNVPKYGYKLELAEGSN